MDAHPESSVTNGLLTSEEAPTKGEWKTLGMPGKTHRCLACNKCNNEAAFESRYSTYLEAGGASGIARRAGRAASKMCATHASQHLATQLTRAEAGFEDGRRSELKSAYIIAFATLGWSYAFDPILDDVREMIRRDSSKTLPPVSCFYSDLPILEQKVAVIESPIRFVMVTHPTLHPHPLSPQQTHAVALPRPHGPPTEELYPALIEAIATHQRIEWIDGEIYDWPTSGYPEFHWDHCDGDHPRSDYGVGLRLET